MNPYIQVLIADLFLACVFVFQKLYQKKVGTAIRAGLTYNALMGLFSSFILFVVNGFHIEIRLISVLLAALFTTVCVLYIFVGFKIMEKGNMALYTLFLMSGGMTVPYVWGVLFLNEPFTLLRTIGLILIIAAIIISNSGEKKPDRKTLLLCVAVFFLNGISSVTSKTHQINPVSQIVTSADFAFLTMVIKTIACSGLLFYRNKTDEIPQKGLAIWPVLLIVFVGAASDVTSFTLQLIGAVNLPATVLYPLVTGGSIILTSLAGVIVFKEKISSRQWIGMAICFAGTLLFL